VTADLDCITAAVAELRRKVPADPDRRGPVPLGGHFEQTGLVHTELPTLTRGAVADFLRREGVPVPDLGGQAEVVAGFLFTAGRVGWAFVSAAEPLPRRRFTAAHELGHFVLHRETMGRFRAETGETLQEADGDAADQMEREANRFAVELLMPADLCRARAEELRRKHGCCPRGVLVYRLASELLVSREAMGYRLKSLGVGDG
jgi:Zn-dependent peptidase ImmA (M78 family)